MRFTLTLMVAVLFAVVLVFKTRAIQREDLWRLPEVRPIWSIWLLLTLALVLLIEPVFVTVDLWVGLNNLAWLLAYICGVGAMAIAGINSASAMGAYGRRVVLAVRLLVVATLSVLVVVYVVGILPSPEWPARLTRNLYDLIFIGVFFTYVAVIFVAVLLYHLLVLRRDPGVRARSRMSVSGIAAFFTLVCALGKLVAGVAGYYDFDSPVVSVANQVAWVSMAIAGLVWVVSTLPGRAFLVALSPYFYFQKLLALRDLRYLRARLLRLTPPVVPYEPTLWEVITNLDFHLYRTLIAVLDGRKLVLGRLAELEAGGPGIGSPAADPPTHRLSHKIPWDEARGREALLYRALMADIGAEEYQEMIAAFQKASRTLRRMGSDQTGSTSLQSPRESTSPTASASQPRS